MSRRSSGAGMFASVVRYASMVACLPRVERFAVVACFVFVARFALSARSIACFALVARVALEKPRDCDPEALELEDERVATSLASARRGPIIPEPLHVPASVIVSRPIFRRTPATLRLVSVVRIASEKRWA